MVKKKVMKTVSVPTLKEVEVATCDICGKEVGDGCMSRYITHTRERCVTEYEKFINELKEYETDKDDYY